MQPQPPQWGSTHATHATSARVRSPAPSGDGSDLVFNVEWRQHPATRVAPPRKKTRRRTGKRAEARWRIRRPLTSANTEIGALAEQMQTSIQHWQRPGQSTGFGSPGGFGGGLAVAAAAPAPAFGQSTFGSPAGGGGFGSPAASAAGEGFALFANSSASGGGFASFAAAGNASTPTFGGSRAAAPTFGGGGGGGFGAAAQSASGFGAAAQSTGGLVDEALTEQTQKSVERTPAAAPKADEVTKVTEVPPPVAAGDSVRTAVRRVQSTDRRIGTRIIALKRKYGVEKGTVMTIVKEVIGKQHTKFWRLEQEHGAYRSSLVPQDMISNDWRVASEEEIPGGSCQTNDVTKSTPQATSIFVESNAELGEVDEALTEQTQKSVERNPAAAPKPDEVPPPVAAELASSKQTKASVGTHIIALMNKYGMKKGTVMAIIKEVIAKKSNEKHWRVAGYAPLGKGSGVFRSCLTVPQSTHRKAWRVASDAEIMYSRQCLLSKAQQKRETEANGSEARDKEVTAPAVKRQKVARERAELQRKAEAENTAANQSLKEETERQAAEMQQRMTETEGKAKTDVEAAAAEGETARKLRQAEVQRAAAAEKAAAEAREQELTANHERKELLLLLRQRQQERQRQQQEQQRQQQEQQQERRRQQQEQQQEWRRRQQQQQHENLNLNLNLTEANAANKSVPFDKQVACVGTMTEQQEVIISVDKATDTSDLTAMDLTSDDCGTTQQGVNLGMSMFHQTNQVLHEVKLEKLDAIEEKEEQEMMTKDVALMLDRWQSYADVLKAQVIQSGGAPETWQDFVARSRLRPSTTRCGPPPLPRLNE
jgi:hypothetical protein